MPYRNPVPFVPHFRPPFRGGFGGYDGFAGYAGYNGYPNYAGFGGFGGYAGFGDQIGPIVRDRHIIRHLEEELAVAADIIETWVSLLKRSIYTTA